MTEARPTLICITPVRNEAWLLDRFLRCASRWADHIVLVDHASTDGSREIARRHEKVVLVEYDAETFDEPERRALLIETARKLPAPGRRILFSIDADEVLAADHMDTPQWQTLLDAAPGTIVYIPWVNVLPGGERAWIRGGGPDAVYVDDGSPYETAVIHGTRVPHPADAAELHLDDIKLLHYKYTDPPRALSRIRWYQCWETIHHPAHRPLSMHRMYHRTEEPPPDEVHPMDDAWLRGYEEAGIDMTSVHRDVQYYWDEQVLDLFAEHGLERFRKLDVWEVDWEARARALEHPLAGTPIRDPRGPAERLIHGWLRRTHRNRSLLVRAGERLLQKLGW